MPELPHHRDTERSTYTLTRGWREKDGYGGVRDYGDTVQCATLGEAQQRHRQWVTWRWADDEFKTDPWVGPIVKKTFRVDDRNNAVGSAKVDELGHTVRRDDPVSVPADSKMQMRRIREELTRRFSLPKED